MYSITNLQFSAKASVNWLGQQPKLEMTEIPAILLLLPALRARLELGFTYKKPRTYSEEEKKN